MRGLSLAIDVNLLEDLQFIFERFKPHSHFSAGISLPQLFVLIMNKNQLGLMLVTLSLFAAAIFLLSLIK